MGRCRKIEITVFRRRIRIFSSDPTAEVVSILNIDSDGAIQDISDEGQETLIEIGSLEEKEVLPEIIRILEAKIAVSRKTRGSA